MRPADWAWLVFTASVIGYEIAAPEGELMSEAADRYMLAHPWITRLAVASIALHLCNAIPARCDPVHVLFVAGQRMFRSR